MYSIYIVDYKFQIKEMINQKTKKNENEKETQLFVFYFVLDEHFF